jgi:hypothetical protein
MPTCPPDCHGPTIHVAPGCVSFECRWCGRAVMGACDGTRLCDSCEDALKAGGEGVRRHAADLQRLSGAMLGTVARWRATPGYGFAADALEELWGQLETIIEGKQ